MNPASFWIAAIVIYGVSRILTDVNIVVAAPLAIATAVAWVKHSKDPAQDSILLAIRRYHDWREQHHWKKWEEVLSIQRRSGGTLYSVISVRQRAKTGTKVQVQRLDGSDVDPAWAGGKQLAAGTIILVGLAYRNGTKSNSHHDENFLHLKDVHCSVSKSAYIGWVHHEAKQRSANAAPA